MKEKQLRQFSESISGDVCNIQHIYHFHSSNPFSFRNFVSSNFKMVQVYLFNLLRERQGDLREGKVCAKTGKGKWCGEIGPTFSFFIIIFDFIQKVVFCVNMFSKVKYTIKYSSLLHCVRPSNLKLSGTSLYFFCWKKVKAPWKVLFSHTLSIIIFAT